MLQHLCVNNIASVHTGMCIFMSILPPIYIQQFHPLGAPNVRHGHIQLTMCKYRLGQKNADHLQCLPLRLIDEHWMRKPRVHAYVCVCARYCAVFFGLSPKSQALRGFASHTTIWGHKSTGCCCGPPAGPVGGCLWRTHRQTFLFPPKGGCSKSEVASLAYSLLAGTFWFLNVLRFWFPQPYDVMKHVTDSFWSKDRKKIWLM